MGDYSLDIASLTDFGSQESFDKYLEYLLIEAMI